MHALPPFFHLSLLLLILSLPPPIPIGQEVVFTPGTFFHPLVNTESGEACRNLYEPSWGATSNLLNLGAKIREAMAQPTAENGINELAMVAIGKPADYFAKAKAACATLPSA